MTTCIFYLVQRLPHRHGKLRGDEFCLYVATIGDFNGIHEPSLSNSSLLDLDLEVIPEPKPARTCIGVKELPMRTDVRFHDSPSFYFLLTRCRLRLSALLTCEMLRAWHSSLVAELTQECGWWPIKAVIFIRQLKEHVT